jgi:hypothetical protein
VTETTLMRKIQVAASRVRARLFRNNCGALMNKQGTWVKFGVASPGGSDLIGFVPRAVTSKDIGKTIAVFAACEVKIPGNKLTKEQQAFLDMVNASGGIGFVARSVEEALGVIEDAQQ